MKRSIYLKLGLSILGFGSALQSNFALATDLSKKFTGDLKATVRGNVDNIVDIATIIIGLAAIITLAYSIFKYFRGDQQSQDMFIKVGGGAFAVAVLSYVIRLVFLSA